VLLPVSTGLLGVTSEKDDVPIISESDSFPSGTEARRLFPFRLPVRAFSIPIEEDSREALEVFLDLDTNDELLGPAVLSTLCCIGDITKLVYDCTLVSRFLEQVFELVLVLIGGIISSA
jgi:hypothetical protein